MTFLLFLIFYILPYLLLIKSYRVYTVTLRPKVIPPIRMLLQTGELLEDPDCRTALHHPHVLRYRKFRRYHHDQVNMVRLNIQLLYGTLLLVRKPVNTTADF